MKDDRKRFRELMGSFDTAMLITRDEESMHARPMAIARIDDDGTLWFVSQTDSGKVDELLEDRHAAVTAQTSTAYAAVQGTCRVLRDEEALEQLWSPAVAVWFERGKRDAVAIQFTPLEAEFWTREFARLRFIFEAARAMITRSAVRPSRLGSHAHLELGGS